MFIYMAIATFVAFWIKGISGFANSLVFGTIMSYRTNTVDISPMDLLLNIPANAFFAWKERKSVQAKVVVPLSILVLAGSIPGALWLSVGDVTTIKVLFGFVVVGIAIEMYLRERKELQVKKSSPVILAIIGIVAGLCSGLFGIGAVLAAYVTRTTKNMSEFRGNLCAVFFVDNISRLCLYFATGVMNFETVKMALLMAPFMASGVAVGLFCTRFASEKTIKKSVIILLFLSGVSLIVTNLM